MEIIRRKRIKTGEICELHLASRETDQEELQRWTGCDRIYFSGTIMNGGEIDTATFRLYYQDGSGGYAHCGSFVVKNADGKIWPRSVPPNKLSKYFEEVVDGSEKDTPNQGSV